MGANASPNTNDPARKRPIQILLSFPIDATTFARHCFFYACKSWHVHCFVLSRTGATTSGACRVTTGRIEEDKDRVKSFGIEVSGPDFQGLEWMDCGS